MNLIDNYKSQITELCDNEIDAFFTYREKRFDDYSKDIILKRAIERNLEIIGEAIGRILKEEPDFSIQNARFPGFFLYCVLINKGSLNNIRSEKSFNSRD